MAKYKFDTSFGTTQYSSEDTTKRTLIQLSIFYLYLISLSIVCNSLTSQNSQDFSQGLRIILERPQHIKHNRLISFGDVDTKESFWNYLEYVVIDLFNSEKTFLNESLILGPPRLRQIRVRNDTCTISPAFSTHFDTCVAPYSMEVECNEPVHKGYSTKYSTISELGVTSINGKLNTYYSAGYVHSLTYEKQTNIEIIQHLRNTKWLDRNSRLVLLEFNLFIWNLNAIQSVKLIFEIMPNGLINSLHNSDILYANSPIISSDWPLKLCFAAVYMINFYYTYVEIKKIYLVGCKKYFLTYSVVFDLPRILILHLSLGFTLYDILKRDISNLINNASGKFISLDHDIYIHKMHRQFLGVLVFFSWIVLLRYMSFYPALRTIGAAMKMAAKDLCAFGIMFFIAITAYANLGFFLFSGSNENFKNLSTAFLTMLRIIIRDFNYVELENDFHVIAPIFFLTYLTLIFLVLLNMFLAVIVLSFRTASKLTSYKPNFICYYIRQKLFRISKGFLKAPKLPKFSDGIFLNQHLDAKKLRELRLISYYTETEEDLDILLLRLDLIENIFHGLTQNMDDLIKQSEAKKS